jgi:hypothetical protein
VQPPEYDFLSQHQYGGLEQQISVILHRWACRKVCAILNCSISYRIHSHNFLITYVALHATAQGGTSPMQGSTWMSGDNEMNLDDFDSYMALLTTLPPDPT